MRFARRLLVFSLIAMSQVASMSWALVLLGVDGSHAASFAMRHGPTLVLHHEGERADHRHHPRGHERHHARHGQSADRELDPHADDHVVSVSGAPASLRSADGERMEIVQWGPSRRVTSAGGPDAVWRGRALVSSGDVTAPRLRATTVLLI